MSDEASMNDTEHQWVEAMIETMRESVMTLQGDADLLAEMVCERCPDIRVVLSQYALYNAEFIL